MIRTYFIGPLTATSNHAESGLEPAGLSDNRVWICQVCGDAFARLVCSGPENRQWPRLWRPELACCEKCQPQSWFWNQVPGSIWASDPTLNEYLPIEVMRRELLLTIRATEGDQL